ncbi:MULTISPECIES: DNA/RNA nuclease SfsA [Halocynthiibacter]|uniref:Sugar fermentation stimulation protein homolog n=1 Tax=Halocynthiibacter halioticoli TaxID=2986804 RepID=A0AAE3LRT1_9RHOB|nr:MULTISPECIES: DNA/RNA nuclease SfsA [Halocynthiibacter]MCV6825882.1 DNA/RNA nuclease SfsA [Halocynthiibacter halioticoli]MCW4058883.1 DNA/RNA nuclease SfsA [Halocynthiibacter sp. SDUM655004]
MKFDSPLVPATLIRRYKRFLADIRLEDGQEVVAHCPNPGSMIGLAQEGARIWVEPNEDPKKKLKFGWRLVEHGPDHFTGIDTGRANRIVAEALDDKKIEALSHYETVKPEVKYGEGSRVDFLLSTQEQRCYLEVKSATLCREPGFVEFPDSVTARGAKHLAELRSMVENGDRAVMLFLVQDTLAKSVNVARDIDPTYANAFEHARARGVEMMAYRANITPDCITLGHELPVG